MPANNDRYCFCPCAKTVMKPWRELHHINFLDSGREKCTDATFTPEKLVQHVRSKSDAGSVVHQGIYLYLCKLYKNYWANEIDHKGLYINPQSRKFIIARKKQQDMVDKKNTSLMFFDMGQILFFEQCESQLRKEGTKAYDIYENQKVAMIPSSGT
jgi:hypothetical protein